MSRGCCCSLCDIEKQTLYPSTCPDLIWSDDFSSFNIGNYNQLECSPDTPVTWFASGSRLKVTKTATSPSNDTGMLGRYVSFCDCLTIKAKVYNTGSFTTTGIFIDNMYWHISWLAFTKMRLTQYTGNYCSLFGTTVETCSSGGASGDELKLNIHRNLNGSYRVDPYLNDVLCSPNNSFTLSSLDRESCYVGVRCSDGGEWSDLSIYSNTENS